MDIVEAKAVAVKWLQAGDAVLSQSPGTALVSLLKCVRLKVVQLLVHRYYNARRNQVLAYM